MMTMMRTNLKKKNLGVSPLLSQLLRLAVLFSVLLKSAQAQSQQQVLNNDSLRQAVALWLGDDHNQAEVLGLLGPIQTWDTSQVTSFASLFKGASTFNDDISAWNTSSVTDMRDVFSGCARFDIPLADAWDFGRVQTTARMFSQATQFDQDLSGLDLSSVTDMTSMFQGATQFKGTGLETWNVTSVRFMNDMFHRATNFNADISNWDTQSVESMESMFQNAVSFNQDVSSWDLSSIVSAENMFQGAMQFEQTLCWDTLPQSAVLTDMFCDAHPQTQLDPCCVVSPSIIRSACCGGASGDCELNCGDDEEEEEDPNAVSNDPEVQIEEEISFSSTPVPFTNNTTTGEGDTSDEANNLQDNDGDIDSENDTTSNSSSDENAWEKHVWLRILVFVVIILILGIIFMNFLTRRSNRANNRAASAPMADTTGSMDKDHDDDAATLEEAKTRDSVEIEEGVDAQECVIPKVTRIR